MIAADVDRSGSLDLVVANSDAASVSILLGSGSGSFASAGQLIVGSGPLYVDASDFNGDDFPDLAVASIFNSSVSVLIGTGSSGAFEPAVQYPMASGTSGLAIADLDDDGTPDIAVVNIIANSIQLLTSHSRVNRTFNNRGVN